MQSQLKRYIELEEQELRTSVAQALKVIFFFRFLLILNEFWHNRMKRGMVLTWAMGFPFSAPRKLVSAQ
jgi:hypothetical protein